jgi:hypothetical protein
LVFSAGPGEDCGPDFASGRVAGDYSERRGDAPETGQEIKAHSLLMTLRAREGSERGLRGLHFIESGSLRWHHCIDVNATKRYVHPSDAEVLEAMEKVWGGHKTGHSAEIAVSGQSSESPVN